MALRPLTVAALGDPAWAKELGKVHTTSDVSLGSFREGDALVAVVAPLRYPEKPQALSYTVLSADAGALAVGALGREVGESILAADAAGLTEGVVVLRNGIQPEQVAPLLKDTALAGWKLMPDDHVTNARQELVKAPTKASPEGPVRVPVDHHFDVKGIGTVALGFVAQGVPRKHDAYRVYPTDLKAQVRSIQVHDEDVAEALPGDHVGFALKGVANDQLDRGHVLAPEGSMEAKAPGAKLELTVRVSPFFKAGVAGDRVLHLGLGWQFVPVRLAGGSVGPGKEGEVQAVVQKPLACTKGEVGVLFDLDAPQRVVGRATVQA